MLFQRCALIWVFPVLLAAMPAVAQDTLALADAERLALAQAPWYARQRANTEAAAERVVHEGRLPDPQLEIGAVNVPTKSFNLRDDDMSMLIIGVRQAFPPGDTLTLRTRRARHDLTIQEARLEIERRNLLRDVRQAWHELRAVNDTLSILKQTRPLLERQRDAAEARYRAAQDGQQVVWQARQELTRLADREDEINARRQGLQATLARWIGAAAYRPLPETAPVPAVLPDTFDPEKNPEWIVARAGYDRTRVDVDLARQQYKPGYAVSVSYGHRRPSPIGAERSDMLTAIVSVDLPLFRSKRQDPRLAEQQHLSTGAGYELQDMRRALIARHDATRAEYLSLARRVSHHERDLLPVAWRESTVAASGFARDQAMLRSARLRALETEIELIRLRRDLSWRHADLLHLLGEPQP